MSLVWRCHPCYQSKSLGSVVPQSPLNHLPNHTYPVVQTPTCHLRLLLIHRCRVLRCRINLEAPPLLRRHLKFQIRGWITPLAPHDTAYMFRPRRLEQGVLSKGCFLSCSCYILVVTNAISDMRRRNEEGLIGVSRRGKLGLYKGPMFIVVFYAYLEIISSLAIICLISVP